MTTERGLNQSVAYFFRKIGFEGMKVRLVPQAFYFTIEDKPTIAYSFDEKVEINLGYEDYLNEHYPNRKPCSFFVFYLLHELGHYLTREKVYRFWKEDREEKKELVKWALDNNIPDRETQYKYCGLYLERIATEKAIQLLEKNYDEIQKFEKRLEKLMNK